jgi:putative endopeptidase
MAPLKVVDASFIDTTTKACTDFFQFANGAWLRTDTIPAAYSYTGVGKDMGDRNELVVRSVLDDVMARRMSLPDSSTDRKLGTFYATCMDSTQAERQGASPIKPELDSIDAIRTRGDLVREIIALQRAGVNALLNVSPDVDPHDAARYVLWLAQGGLGLPDRDYYTKPGASADSLRRAYVAHVAASLRLAGEPRAQAALDATRIMRLETALARASLTREAQRDPSATDHPTSIAVLRTMTPAIDWTQVFATAGLTAPVTHVNVAEPVFVKRASALVAEAPLDEWRAYLRYHVIAESSPWLSTPFVREDFAFRSRFTGAKELLPRWKRCLRKADRDLGEALGQAYVSRTFSPDAKARARAVIEDVRSAFRARLLRLTWMSDSTRQRALEKLDRMREKVGYPDHWRDYSRLTVQDGPFIQNVFQANLFEWRRVINRPGTAVDTTEWDMTVPTVNAYYDPSKNEMVFPAGALVPQTFDPSADDGANYGSLAGSWAGHELTHGFDDEGRHFDDRGNLKDWWTAADATRFQTQADLMAAQYSSYIQVDTSHVNGKLTLGENIADNGGLLTGYDALERALDRDGTRPTVGLIDGYTPEQRYFISFAQSFRAHNRDEELKSRLATDPHSPEEWRVNGPVSNSADFARAFACKPGDPMVRPADTKPQIW